MTDNGVLRPVRVFISYARDSQAQCDLVRRLWELLRKHGIDARSDLDVNDRQEWPRWMERQMAECDYVLVVASPEYRVRADRRVAEVGRGVEYESSLIREHLYADRERWFRRILPVVLPGGDRHDLPEFVSRFGGTVYWLSDFSLTGAEALLRTLTRQAAVPAPPIGAVPQLPPRPIGDDRRHLEVELVELLSTLPVSRTAGARHHLTGMLQDRLGGVFDVPGDAEPQTYLTALVETLFARRGLATLADIVTHLHGGEDVEAAVRALVVRLDGTN